MSSGRVSNQHLLFPVTFRLPQRPDLNVEFVVDTGFTGFLTLSPKAITAMGLSFLYRIPADLADASTVELDVYDAPIIWNGVERHVPLLAIGQRPLLGTAFLKDCEVTIQFVENGLVMIKEM